LDDGVTNTSCGTSGQIDSTIWNGLNDGIYTLKFYANNSFGLIGEAEKEIVKDTTKPSVIINSPTNNEEFIDTTLLEYDITIIELHLYSIWYTVDNGITNITITEEIGNIDETIWGNLPDGEVTISFYAEDTVGNVGFSSVTVYKRTQGIPGFYPILILVIITAGTIGLTCKQTYKNSTRNKKN
jgi:hypothetical protein